MSELEENIKQILFSNDPTVIAEEVVDLLLRVREPDVLDDAFDLLYPRFDHCKAGRALYVAAREQAISAGASSAQSAHRVESL